MAQILHIFQAKKNFKVNLVVSEASITHITNGARLARCNIYMHANHSYNSQMILKWHSYYIFFNNSQAKKILSEFGGIRGIFYFRETSQTRP